MYLLSHVIHLFDQTPTPNLELQSTTYRVQDAVLRLSFLTRSLNEYQIKELEKSAGRS
jgi:hypothetical protein